MTKEEKIKEAWGVAYEEVRGMLTENGYIPSIDLAHSNLKLSIYHIQLTYNKIGVRPVILQGIENNNGWIKIESEDDLPKEKCDLLVYPEFENQFVFHFYNDKKSKEVLMQNHTHYQPIEKPKPPIY